jgi:hypothetical protein
VFVIPVGNNEVQVGRGVRAVGGCLQYMNTPNPSTCYSIQTAQQHRQANLVRLKRVIADESSLTRDWSGVRVDRAKGPGDYIPCCKERCGELLGLWEGCWCIECLFMLALILARLEDRRELQTASGCVAGWRSQRPVVELRWIFPSSAPLDNCRPRRGNT